MISSVNDQRHVLIRPHYHHTSYVRIDTVHFVSVTMSVMISLIVCEAVEKVVSRLLWFTKVVSLGLHFPIRTEAMLAMLGSQNVVKLIQL